MNKIWKFLKENIILIIPPIFVLLLLVGFLIFGFQRPVSSDIEQVADITVVQEQLQEEFMSHYDPLEHSVTNPYIVLDPFEFVFSNPSPIPPFPVVCVTLTPASGKYK